MPGVEPEWSTEGDGERGERKSDELASEIRSLGESSPSEGDAGAQVVFRDGGKVALALRGVRAATLLRRVADIVLRDGRDARAERRVEPESLGDPERIGVQEQRESQPKDQDDHPHLALVPSRDTIHSVVEPA